jgi:hypothetical protein
VVFSEDNFGEIEEEMRLNPPGFGQASDELTIYSKTTKKIIQNALNEQLDRVYNKKQLAPLKSSSQTKFNPYLKVNKDGIKVFIYKQKNSKFGTFKAITHIKASLDSILSVLFDNNAYEKWVHACDNSFIIKQISFNERYHYQTMDIPFPFANRGFILHSVMTQDPDSKTINITSSVDADFCNNNDSEPCAWINQSADFKVTKSIGTFQLQPDSKGTKITWIQHTDPAGNLPAWLVNQFVADTPYWTLKNLIKLVKEEKYKNSKLIYDNQGVAINLKVPKQKPISTAKDYVLFPSF